MAKNNKDSLAVTKRLNNENATLKKHLQEDDIEYIKSSLVAKKTVDFLVANAQIV
jgi:hypothetical protein